MLCDATRALATWQHCRRQLQRRHCLHGCLHLRNMNVSWEVYLRDIHAIQQLSKQIYDNWTICQQSNFYNKMNTYLTKHELKPSKTDATLLLSFEYHVVYDAMYSVPKLCFNVFNSDGSLLKFENCVQQLNFNENERVLDILTQMDHPVLQKPFYCLHPCRTADLMQNIATNSKNVLVTWLSTIGPSVGLHLDNIYAQLT